MQLAELIQIIIEEAQSSRDELLGCTSLLTTLEDGDTHEGALNEAAATYANFCERAAMAAQSLGLAGLSSASSAIGEGLAMASSLPLDMRVPASALLTHWPDFFTGYLKAWHQGHAHAQQQDRVAGLLSNMLQADFVTPLDEAQFDELRTQLLNPPRVADQQSALLPAFELPSADAMSLHAAEDAEIEVIDGFLSEGPAQVERLASIVVDLVSGRSSPAQLELAHRTAHTLKGTAAIAGIRGIATLAHSMEDILEAFRREDFQAPPGLNHVLTAGCDQLELALDYLNSEGPKPEDFERVTCQLYAWSCQLQGIAVPPGLLPEPTAANDITAPQPVTVHALPEAAVAAPAPAPVPAPLSLPLPVVAMDAMDAPESIAPIAAAIAATMALPPILAVTPAIEDAVQQLQPEPEPELEPEPVAPRVFAAAAAPSSPATSTAPATPAAQVVADTPIPVTAQAAIVPLAATAIPAFSLPPLLPAMGALPVWPVIAPAAAPQPASGEADAAADEDLQVRISAKALDKIFRAVNELAIGLLRLRTQNDDILTRSNALLALDQVATQRLADIEQRVNLEGLGRSSTSASASAASASAAAFPASPAAIYAGPQGDSHQLGSPYFSGAQAIQPTQNGFDALEMDRYNELTGATQALSEAIDDMRGARDAVLPSLREVSVLTQRQLDIAREARFQIAQARLRPLSGLRARMRRTVRQTGSAVGREALLEIIGDDLRVDAAVLGPLSEALLHLLRNCVDHGIETPQERIAAGKPAQGTIRVTFAGLGSGVVITIADDGRGLDHEAIFNKALWSGLVPSEAKLTKEEIGRLIFLPGFSTRSAVTETSGRGVGLDAVAQAVASLQGSIGVTSVTGSHTEFRLFVLSSIGTVHALHLEAGGEHFLVPSNQLERVDAAPFLLDLQLDATPDAAVATQSLQQLLHGSAGDAYRQTQDQITAIEVRPALVINVDGVQRRIAVDRIIEAREFLIAPVPTLIDRMSGVSGVATLADGSLGLVLDLVDLSRKPLPVQSQGLQRLADAVQQQAHILVADDSASVRNTISALLRDENYRVTTARDGLDAMRAMQDNQFSLVLTDLEMPQANGFELTEFIRNRSSQPTVPVIMLTSRGQDKHRERATAVGVNAFLVKPYSDEGLLQAMRAALDAAPADSLRNKGARDERVQDNSPMPQLTPSLPLSENMAAFAKALS
jgi:chemotaxis protein histidine kinase CheA/DNA-binding NarL/FixJ family response regulator